VRDIDRAASPDLQQPLFLAIDDLADDQASGVVASCANLSTVRKVQACRLLQLPHTLRQFDALGECDRQRLRSVQISTLKVFYDGSGTLSAGIEYAVQRAPSSQGSALDLPVNKT
jgi:hypothetical protein